MKNTIIILIVLILIAAGGYFYAVNWYENSISEIQVDLVEPGKEIEFEIISGETPDEIATKLVEAGIIKSDLAFVLYARLNPDKTSAIQAGKFKISSNNSISELFEIFQKAETSDIKVTIPEGLRSDEMAKIFAKRLKKGGATFNTSRYLKIIADPDSASFSEEISAFLKENKPVGVSLEGFLFPDTYFFSKDDDEKVVLEKQLANLAERIEPGDLKKAQKSEFSFYQHLIIASMIERETFTEKEKPDVADIFQKRLIQGVNGVKLLQVDATLLFIAKDWKADVVGLKNSDNPYNTYKFVGLPPGPIANPGLSSIEASIRPKKNNYFFYIHDEDGVVHFAETQAEHDQNVIKYLRSGFGF